MFGVFEFSLRCNGLKPSRAKLRSGVRDCAAVRVHARLMFARVCICGARTCVLGHRRCFVHHRPVAVCRNFISRMFDLRKK